MEKAEDKFVATVGHCRCAGNGFTLIELMIVLAVMSLLLVLTAPRMAGNLLGLTLTTAAKKTASMLRYARSQALATGTPHAAVFDCEQHRLIVAPLPRTADMTVLAAAAVPHETVEEYSPRQIKTYTLPEQVRFDVVDIGTSRCNESSGSDICQMVFYADGTSHGGHITIMDSRDRRYEIRVEILTGEVALEEPSA